MIPYRYLQTGTPWRVNIAITDSMDDDIVIPDNVHQDQENIGGQRHTTSETIVLLGFTYNILTSAGASLSLIDHDNPWITPGTPADDPIWVDTFNAAGRFKHDARCFVPLGETGQRARVAAPNSANDGGRLKIATSAAITSGFIHLYGVYTGDECFRSKQSTTGLANDFRTT